jgi:hypothetical protein
MAPTKSKLVGTLIESHALPDAIDYVAVEYTRRTGGAPKKSTATPRLGLADS